MDEVRQHPDDEVLRLGEDRLRVAQAVIDRLDLLHRWSAFGQPVLVGAVGLGLVVRPDIDLEVFCERPRIEDGFAVVSNLALVPGVLKVRFSNELGPPHHGLYWQLRYCDPSVVDGEIWKVDMWLLGQDCPGPVARDLVEPLTTMLTPEHRAAILHLKHATLADARVKGIDIYRAVIEGGVRSQGELRAWLDAHGSSGLTTWRPNADLSASPTEPRHGQ